MIRATVARTVRFRTLAETPAYRGFALAAGVANMQPSTILLLAGLISDRERKGTKWCERWGIGKRRQLVPMMLPHGVYADGTAGGYVDAARESAAILATECRRCRGCPLWKT